MENNYEKLLIKDLDLPVRIVNALEKVKIRSVEDLRNVTLSRLVGIRNIGDDSLFPLLTKLSGLGIRIKNDPTALLNMGLTPKVVACLQENGVLTVEDIRVKGRDELGQIKGMRKNTIVTVMTTVEQWDEQHQRTPEQERITTLRQMFNALITERKEVSEKIVQLDLLLASVTGSLMTLQAQEMQQSLGEDENSVPVQKTLTGAKK